MPTIKADFYGDWIEILRQELTSIGYPPPPGDPQQVCFRYFNLNKRSIQPRPRTVHQSPSLTVPPQLTAGLASLKAKLASGVDVRAHLSTSLLDPDYDDLLLNDWGIHHLHLGMQTHPTQPSFVERTDPVLAALILPNEAYVIDFIHHGEWACLRLLEIIQANWPAVIESHRFKGIIRLGTVPTDEDIRKLRRAHINVMVQLSDGSIYGMMGGGISTSGLGAAVVRTCDYYAILLRRIQTQFEEQADAIADRIAQKGHAPGDEIVLRLHRGTNDTFVAVVEGLKLGFVVLEPTTGHE